MAMSPHSITDTSQLLHMGSSTWQYEAMRSAQGELGRSCRLPPAHRQLDRRCASS